MTSASLLDALCGLLRRTYALTAPLRPIGCYVIGDEGLRTLYPNGERDARSATGAGARLLLRETPAGVRACIYYPDAMIRHLESKPPQLDAMPWGSNGQAIRLGAAFVLAEKVCSESESVVG